MYQQISTNKRKTAVLFLTFALFIIGLGWAFSYIYDSQAILIGALIFTIIQSWISYYYSASISLAVTGAKEAPVDEYRELHNLVVNIAITAGLPKPKVYIINDPSPNAFATGRDPKHSAVAFTTGILQTLDRTELEGVVAHEMAHIGNRDTLLMTVAVTLVGAIVLFSDMFLRSLWFRDSGSSNSSGGSNNSASGYLVLIGIILAILAPLFAKLIELAISRKREFLADATAVMLTRYPEGLASALVKIEQYERPMTRANRATAHLYINEPFGVNDRKRNWLMTIFSTHPPIPDRVTRLRAMFG